MLIDVNKSIRKTWKMKKVTYTTFWSLLSLDHGENSAKVSPNKGFYFRSLSTGYRIMFYGDVGYRALYLKD